MPDTIKKQRTPSESKEPSVEDQLNILKEENKKLKEKLKRQLMEKEIKEKEMKNKDEEAQKKENELKELQEIIMLQTENKKLDKQIVMNDEQQTKSTAREEKARIDKLIEELEQLKVELQQQNDLESTTIEKHEKERISFKDILNILPEFSGNDDYDVESWIRDVESTAKEFKWTNLQQTIFAKRLLIGTAKLALRSNPNLNNWEELKTFLRQEFKFKITSAEIHKKLQNRKQERNENIQEYFLKMREIAARSPCIDEETIIHYVIKGINDNPENKSILFEATNFQEFRDKIPIYLKYKDSLKNFSNTTKEYTRKIDIRRNESQQPKTVQTRCYNCGKTDHLKNECPQNTPKCFKCNEFGHIARNCTVKSIKYIKSGKNTQKLIKINDTEISALIDTGSDISIIRIEDFHKINAPELNTTECKIQGLSGETMETLGSFKAAVEIDNNMYTTQIYVVSGTNLKTATVIGRDILSGTNIKLTDDNIKISKINPELTSCYNITAEKEELKIGNKNYLKEINNLVTKYTTENKYKDTDVKLKIILSDEVPIKLRPRRMAPLEKKIIDDQIEEWLKLKIIRPSESEFSSPIQLANKKDGGKRLCIDYRKLNKKVIKDRYPLPLIEDQIDSLSKAKIFSTLDLKNGFFHVEVDEKSKKYTSFVTPSGQYEFNRTPFGLCTSPTVFQKYINKIFQRLIEKKFVLIYMDDIIILSETYEEGMKRLKEAMKLAEEYGLEIKWSKCQFLCTEIDYLGFKINDGKITPSELKTNAVKNFPEPKSIKNVQSFLGLTGFFRKFIKSYSVIARPLTNLLKKNSEFKFGIQEKLAVNQLKQLLSEQPVLTLYRQDSETEIHTDASKWGFGAVLLQKREDNQLHPVCYHSKKTSSAEERYSSYELEVLAIISALKKFRVYVLGIKFKIFTDCSAFKQTMEKQNILPRIAGWALALQEYDYQLEHRPGIRMKHVDALSRNPVMMVITNQFLDKIKHAQNTDKELQLINKILENVDIYDGYFKQNDIIYKDGKDGKLLCVPKNMQNEIIKNIHDDGHFGYKKMEDLISREYYISRLKEKIESCRRNCVRCILADKKAGKPEGYLNPIYKNEQPLDTYHIDHLGPMTNTTKKYSYILCVIDAFSKFCWIYPTKSTTTEEVLQKLNLQKDTFGNPRRMITDRGTAFTSNKFKEYCEEENIIHLQIATGIPRGNGQVERINAMIIPVLTKLAIDEPAKWYTFTGKLQRGINSTYQRSIGISPFELLTGVSMRNNTNTILSEAVDEEFKKAFIDNREESRETARKNIEKIQNENRKYYNKSRKVAKNYKLGDLIAIKRCQFTNNSKISTKFLGPFKITRCAEHDRYHVEKVGTHDGPNKTITSADNMKSWYDITSSDEEEDFLGFEEE